MSPLRDCDAIIFDLDGVLWDSSRAHAEAFRRTFASIGIPFDDYSSVAGMRTDAAVAKILAGAGRVVSPEEATALVAQKRRYSARELAESPPLAEGLLDCLDRLGGRHTLALASSASSGSVRVFLDAIGGAARFAYVLTGDDVANAKPAPEIYQRTLAQLGTPSDRAIVVEDAVSGVQSARAAGVRVVGVLGTCAESDLRSAGAEWIVDRVADLVSDDRADPNTR